MLGAVPVPNKISEMKKFYKTIETRIQNNKPVVVYPEAHLWPYYKKIREFPDTSFKFPVNLNVPSFCITTTYQKRKNRKKSFIGIWNFKKVLYIL